MSMRMSVGGSDFGGFDIAAVCLGLAAITSGAIFNKLSHIVEYTLNKRCGDYNNLRKTIHGDVIVSRYQDYYIIQNIVLAVLVGRGSALWVQRVCLPTCPKIISHSLIIGSLVIPIVWGLFNIGARLLGVHRGRWVQLSDDEVQERKIKIVSLPGHADPEYVYLRFAAAPELMLGWGLLGI